MANFDDNPFGDSNLENPFADVSIRQAVSTSNTSHLNNNQYDPFSETPQAQITPTAVNITIPNSTGAAIVEPIQQAPAYTKSAQQRVLDTEQLKRRQEELERKEEELDRREQELRRSSEQNHRRNNWPPLPEQCCFQPCFYQDIQIDIPVEFQKIVRNLYYLWMFHGIILCVNLLGGIILLDFTIIGLSIIYLVIFTPFSYLCWFRPAYKAFRSDSSFNFMVFFFVFFFQFCVTAIQSVGITDSGTFGIVTAIRYFQSTEWPIPKGLLALLIALGFALAALADLLLITKIHRLYRSTGASMAKAQEEFTSEFLRNQHVRGAASSVASAAVQQHFSGEASRY